MPINFHDEKNKGTYTTRTADDTWMRFIEKKMDVHNKVVADIGCGGGIYTKAFSDLGASHVTGVDFSKEMLIGAADNCKEKDNITFVLGDAFSSNLPSNSNDIVLERALIHHLNDLMACFKEANRALKTNGLFIVQDRTPEDCLLPGDANHLRGYFFEKFPQLIEKEVARRYTSDQVRSALAANGFELLNETQLWETRRVYEELGALTQDLLQRTGRSILHDITDSELQELVVFITKKLENTILPIVEKDSWTVWIATKK
ncbi:class I SAM-dependent methyltransferase [Paenibacillus chondroitinus]|uniref:Class I SAM-dependent methyltransferase n=1 Tax=Paenibacillus chondroitinus TaxID=59842 RepID=A0ABU6DFH9_9BACL|nr:class I SAM-dependent methyltransferase [Paenibacillus chondroitinus]MCY9659246.1 class I SAM-dependent methyltransferase [Paenibacillus anseongense]MEB4796419.1 class I SAM-dependent methyltransferase [Paenibacillus chondroitinus]